MLTTSPARSALWCFGNPLDASVQGWQSSRRQGGLRFRLGPSSLDCQQRLAKTSPHGVGDTDRGLDFSTASSGVLYVTDNATPGSRITPLLRAGRLRRECPNAYGNGRLGSQQPVRGGPLTFHPYPSRRRCPRPCRLRLASQSEAREPHGSRLPRPSHPLFPSQLRRGTRHEGQLGGEVLNWSLHCRITSRARGAQ